MPDPGFDDEHLSAYRHTFAELFREWRVSLPESGVARGACGVVKSDNGTIQFRLHDDWGDRYLELYSCERGAGDRLYRIHEDGRAELIAASLDARARATLRGLDEDHRFYGLVSERGFQLPRR